jgi:nicotinate-nucleotide pyrophosphorylase (carboxylating)
VEIEVESLAELDQALTAGAKRVLVDNFSLDDQREAVRRAAGKAVVEISGGVTLDRLPEVASTGAQFVSIGALTHSARAADISFEIEPL